MSQNPQNRGTEATADNQPASSRGQSGTPGTNPPTQPQGMGQHPEATGPGVVDMPITNQETFPDKAVVESLGIARGNSVRARNIGRDITQSIRNILGGELKAYTTLMTDAREQALDRMLDDAAALGADGVVNIRFETSEISGTGAELLAYGTAVRLGE